MFTEHSCTPHCFWPLLPCILPLLQIQAHHVFSDGESDTSGIAWHLHVRDRLPLDLIALVPLLVKQVNRGVKPGGYYLVWGPYIPVNLVAL